VCGAIRHPDSYHGGWGIYLTQVRWGGANGGEGLPELVRGAACVVSGRVACLDYPAARTEVVATIVSECATARVKSGYPSGVAHDLTVMIECQHAVVAAVEVDECARRVNRPRGSTIRAIRSSAAEPLAGSSAARAFTSTGGRLFQPDGHDDVGAGAEFFFGFGSLRCRGVDVEVQSQVEPLFVS
jgi:hypothetical protein